jgi:hypothetical protein
MKSSAVALVVRAIGAAIGPRECALIGGLGLVAYGLYGIYPPAALFVPGAVLVYVSIAGLS